jgi:phosphoglycerate-specific signal transduction histidine kinase
VTASLHALADQSGWTLVTVHRAGTCELLRGDPERILGLRSEDLADGGLAKRVVGAEPSPCAWREACDSSIYLLRDSQGSAQWVESQSRSDGDGVLVVSTRRAGPADLQGLLRLARLTFGGSLLGPLSHEVNNLVQGLSSVVYLFRDCLENGEPVELEDVAQLDEAVQELKKIGAEVQGFARLSATSRPVALKSVIEQAVGLLTSMGKLKTVEVAVELADDLPALQLPTLALDTVILALLSNAAEAAQDNPEEDQRVRVIARAEQAGVVIEFHDSGTGFVLHKSAPPFVTSRAAHRNSGLGLTAVAALVESYGGTLEAESSDRGSLVRVAFERS